MTSGDISYKTLENTHLLSLFLL